MQIGKTKQNQVKETIIVFLLIGIISLLFGLIFKRSACLFLNITGVPCPACGMTRAYVALFRGDLSQAFYYHPLFLMPIIIIVISHNKIMANKKLFNGLVISLIIILLIVYIIRLILLFPEKEPLTFFSDAILPRLFLFIKYITSN